MESCYYRRGRKVRVLRMTKQKEREILQEKIGKGRDDLENRERINEERATKRSKYRLQTSPRFLLPVDNLLKEAPSDTIAYILGVA